MSDTTLTADEQAAAADLAARARAAAGAPALAASPDIAAAVEAERRRCLSILEMAQPGYEREIRAALETGASVEQTAVKILTEQRSRGITLTQIAADGRGVPFAAAAAPGRPQTRLRDAAPEVYARRKAVNPKDET